MARSRQPRNLHEWNAALAALELRRADPDLAGSPKMSVMAQAKLLARGIPKASRVGEFVAMWAIAKDEHGVVTVEDVAKYWDEAPRTMYRRLSEFRDLWGIVGLETPDPLADQLIAEYRRRQERIAARDLAVLMTLGVSLAGVRLPAA